MTRELEGTVTQTIPCDDLDQYIISIELYEAVESHEQLVRVQTHDPHPTTRQIIGTIPGTILGFSFTSSLGSILDSSSL